MATARHVFFFFSLICTLRCFIVLAGTPNTRVSDEPIWVLVALARTYASVVFVAGLTNSPLCMEGHMTIIGSGASTVQCVYER